MAKKKSASARAKAPKRRRFVAGLVAGKSMYQAALGAGYSKSMARNAGEKIMPGAREEFKEALARKVPQGKLIQRIAEGLDAKETRLSQFQGDFIDQRHLVNYSERRRYVELAAKLLGFLVEQVEVGGREEGPPVNLDLNVNFVDPEKLSDVELEKILIESRKIAGDEAKD